MEKELNELEKITGEIDHLFQEGVLITKKEQNKLELLAKTLLGIANDHFLNVK